MAFAGAPHPHFASLSKRRERICEQKKCQVERSEWEEGGWREGAGLWALPELTILPACFDMSCSEEGIIIFRKGFLTYH